MEKENIELKDKFFVLTIHFWLDTIVIAFGFSESNLELWFLLKKLCLLMECTKMCDVLLSLLLGLLYDGYNI